MFKKKSFFDSGSSGNNSSNNIDDGEIAELKRQIAKLEEQVRVQKEIKTTLLEEHTREIDLLTNENKELNSKIASLTAENESLRNNFEKLKGIFDSTGEDKIILFFGSKTAQDSAVQSERLAFSKFMAYEKRRIDNIMRTLKGMEPEDPKGGAAASGEDAKGADAWSGFKSLNDSVSALADACVKIKTVPEVEKVLADVPVPPPESDEGKLCNDGNDSDDDSKRIVELVDKKLETIESLVIKQNELMLRLKQKP